MAVSITALSNDKNQEELWRPYSSNPPFHEDKAQAQEQEAAGTGK